MFRPMIQRGAAGGTDFCGERLCLTNHPPPPQLPDHPRHHRFEGGGRVIVVSGDTRPTEAIVAACNGCDVLVFTASQFQQLAQSGEPVVSDILRDGLALIGSMPRTRDGAA